MPRRQAHQSTASQPELSDNGRRFRPKRVAELVADEVRHQIVMGEIEDELPREEILLDRFSVSRPSLREALRILETQGLIRVRLGRQGGATVQRPAVDGAAYYLGLVLQTKQASLSDLATARLVLEPECAALAAARPDHEEIATGLLEVVDANETLLDAPSKEFTQSAQEFHSRITSGCGNETLALLVSALEAVWDVQEQRWAEAAAAEGTYPQKTLRRDVLRAHRNVARRIRAGEATGARRAMRVHLEHSQPFVNVADGIVQILEVPPRR